MPRIVKGITIGMVLAMVLSAALYRLYHSGVWLTAAITFGTAAYHLAAHLLIGDIVNAIMHNHADYRKKWYQPRSFEPALYRFLKVKKWKDKMPTFEPGTFSAKEHSFDEIAQVMCQSEVVHELCILSSFLPLAASLKFGAFPVFLATSMAVACFDAALVMMQRYNRPRIIKLAKRQKV